MARMYGELNDVKGAFLNGDFTHGEKLYMEIPEGFEWFYPTGVLLLLLKTIYGLKQSAFEYWRVLLKAMRGLGLLRSKADPCVYYKWTKNGICLWTSWVDDLLSIGKEKDVIEGREKLKKYFSLDEVGEVSEYVGCKVEYNKEEGYMKLTQPVLIQSFRGEFELPEIEYKTPAAPNESLVEGPVLEEEMHKQYRKGVGKLIHLSKYSRPDLLNAVRELTRFGSKPSLAHYKAMLRVMKFCCQTRAEGLMINPNKRWDGVNKNYLFEITGESDSTFASDPETKRSVSGWSAKLKQCTIHEKEQNAKICDFKCNRSRMRSGD